MDQIWIRSGRIQSDASGLKNAVDQNWIRSANSGLEVEVDQKCYEWTGLVAL